MSEALVAWARRKAGDLSRFDVAKVEQAAGARILAQALADDAPKRTGRLSRLFLVAGNTVKNPLPYVFKVDRGGLILAKTRDLVIPLTPGYRAGMGGFVTVGLGHRRMVIRPGTQGAVAFRRRSVMVRARPYLDRALQSWRIVMDAKVKKDLDTVFR